MYYQYMSLSPVTFPNLLTSNSEIHDHSTRLYNQIHVQHRRTALVGSSFLNRGPRYWDELPENIKNTLSKDHFKVLHKNYTLNNL